MLKFDASDPHWPDRDRFVLSGGHGCMLLYSCYLTGVGGAKGLGIDDIKQFRQVGSRTPGHPECGTGALRRGDDDRPRGLGISTAVGMAIAERMLAARFPGNR